MKRILALLLSALAPASEAAVLEIWALNEAPDPVQAELVARDGETVLARWDRQDANPGEIRWLDPAPDALRVRWRSGPGEWTQAVLPLSVATSDTVRVHLVLPAPGGEPRVVAPRPPEPAPAVEPEVAPEPRRFEPFPLLSLRAGVPGAVGLQAGAVLGWWRHGHGGESGSAGRGLLLALEADLGAPSGRIGIASLAAGPGGIGSASLSAACRLDGWGSARLEACGPELDLMMQLVHLRLGWFPATESVSAGLGIGL